MTDPDGHQIFGRAAALLDLRRHDEALALLAPAAAREPDNPGLQRLVSRALLGVGRHDDAIAAAARAIAADPSDADGHECLATALLDRRGPGDSLTALHAANEAVRLDPTSATAWFTRTLGYLRLGDTAAAHGCAGEVARLTPGTALGHHALGLVAIEQKRWPDAEHHFAAALRIRPDWAAAINNYGLARLHQGHSREAVDHFATAARLDPRLDVGAKNVTVAAKAWLGRGAVAFFLLFRFAWIAPGPLRAVLVAAAGIGLGAAAYQRHQKLKTLPVGVRLALRAERQSSWGFRTALWAITFAVTVPAALALLVALAMDPTLAVAAWAVAITGLAILSTRALLQRILQQRRRGRP